MENQIYIFIQPQGKNLSCLDHIVNHREAIINLVAFSVHTDRICTIETNMYVAELKFAVLWAHRSNFHTICLKMANPWGLVSTSNSLMFHPLCEILQK